MEPAAASNTASGTPEASSATSITWSLWIPCRASGCSAREVRAEMNISSGAALNTMRSCLTVTMSCSGVGIIVTQRLSSANMASNSCELVGAVTTTFTGERVMKYHSIAQLDPVDLPTPCPERTEILRSPRAMAVKNLICHSSGSAPKTSCTKSTGSSWYRSTHSSKTFFAIVGNSKPDQGFRFSSSMIRST